MEKLKNVAFSPKWLTNSHFYALFFLVHQNKLPCTELKGPLKSLLEKCNLWNYSIHVRSCPTLSFPDSVFPLAFCPPVVSWPVLYYQLLKCLLITYRKLSTWCFPVWNLRLPKKIKVTESDKMRLKPSLKWCWGFVFFLV